MFASELFERAVYQLIAGTQMVGIDHELRTDCRLNTPKRIGKRCSHRRVCSQVGVDNRLRAGKLEDALALLVGDRLGTDCATEAAPAAAPVAELTVLPDAALFLVLLKLLVRHLGDVFGDILLDFPANDEADIQPITELEKTLIIEARIGDNANRYLLLVVTANQPYQLGNDTNDVVSVIAVCLSFAEDRIDDHAVPKHLQRLKSFHLLVGWCYPFTLVSIIVIHHHRVDTEPDYLRLLNAHSPQEHGAKHLAKHPHSHDRDRAEKSFDRVGGDHAVLGGLDRTGISRVLSQTIKAPQVQIGTIDEEAENLMEDLT